MEQTSSTEQEEQRASYQHQQPHHDYDSDNDNDNGSNDNGSNDENTTGIFSSTICDMFQRKATSKTDACALACCGIWLWERNQFLLLSVKPKPISQRPLILVLLVLTIIGIVVWSFDDSNDTDNTDNTDNTDTESNNDNDNDNNSDNYSYFLPIVTVAILAGILFKLEDFQQSRGVFRKELVAWTFLRNKKSQRQHDNDDDDDDDDHGEEDIPIQSQNELNLYMRQHEVEIYRNHACCGYVRIIKEDKDDNNDMDVHADGNEDNDDFLTCLWNCIASSCCGKLCCHWLQCCGMCAIAQEHRHLRTNLKYLLLPSSSSSETSAVAMKRLLQRDYITMQAWSDYFPQILELRRKGEQRFLPHLTTLSLLSYRILLSAAIFLTGTVVLTALPVRYSKWELIVLFATLLQPIVIWFVVHWIWHRLDISMDAVVKYFASGFVICTSMAIAYEMILSILVYGALFVSGLVTAAVLVVTGQIPYARLTEPDDDTIASISLPKVELPAGYIFAFSIVGAFLNSFVVAALVEEMCKYLCFWMVEHPDLEDDVYLTKNENADDHVDDESDMPQHSQPRVKLVSRGAGITVAMVTTALGFACAENLLYVFVYAPPGVASELVTLVVRCIFPIHPLAAALQSIGVCRRDLEGDSSTKVGRILLPACILHGTYDFVIMAYTIVTKAMKTNYGQESTGVDEGSGDSEEEGDDAGVLVFLAMIYFALVGIFYYFKESWAQRKRLADLDQLAAQNLYERLTS